MFSLYTEYYFEKSINIGYKLIHIQFRECQSFEHKLFPRIPLQLIQLCH